MQQQSRRTDMRCECPVLGLVTVLRISDDGVSEVPHVKADLVIPTCKGSAFHQGEPRAWVPRNGIGELAGPQWLERGARHARWAGHALGQRLTDAARVVHIAANDAQVLLARMSLLELAFAAVDGFGILAEYNDTAGRLVQAVDRVKSPFVVSFQKISEVLIFMCIDGCSVHQQTRSFVHCEVAFILEKQPNLSGTR